MSKLRDKINWGNQYATRTYHQRSCPRIIFPPPSSLSLSEFFASAHPRIPSGDDEKKDSGLDMLIEN